MGDESRSAGAVCYAPASQECGSPPGVLSNTINPTGRPSPDWCGFRRKTDMDMTKFFTEQVTSGSRGEAFGTRPPARNRGTIMTPMTFRFGSSASFRCPSSCRTDIRSSVSPSPP